MSVSVKLAQKISNKRGDVQCLTFCGNLLAFGSSDKLVRVFSTTADGAFSERTQSPLCGHSYAVTGCCFDSTGRLFVSCSQDGSALLWDIEKGKKLGSVIHESGAQLKSVQLSPDGRLLATGCDDECAAFWDVASQSLIRLLEGHEATVVAVSFTPDGLYLVTGSSTGDLRVWDGRYGHGRHLKLLKQAHDLGVTCLQFSPVRTTIENKQSLYGDGQQYLLATGGNDNLVKLWRVTATQALDVQFILYCSLEGHTLNVMCLAFSPLGDLLASGAGDRSVIIWEPAKGLKLSHLTEHKSYVSCCAFSGDGRLLATGSNDKTVALWRLMYGAGGETPGAGNAVATAPLICLDDDLPAAFEVKCPAEWSVADVSDWLKSISMSEYVSAFEANSIDGQELLLLSDTMLKNALAIEPLGHRNRLMRETGRLKTKMADSSLPGAVPVVAVAGGTSQLASQSLKRQTSNASHEFFCPITYELMTDPVIASDGYTYERSAITSWFVKGNKTSPMTNAPLAHTELTPNRMLKMMIQRHLQKQKGVDANN